MLKDYQIIDADSHVTEPIEMWEEYLEPEFKNHAPYIDIPKSEDGVFMIDVFSPPVKNMKVEGKKIYQKISDEIWAEGIKVTIRDYAKRGSFGTDPASQVKAIKRMGVDISFLYPTIGLWILAIEDMNPQLAVALTRAYNNWLHDFCNYDKQILKGVGAISLHEPQEMVGELRRIASFGWKAVFIRPNPIKGRILSDPAYEPFWAECEKLNIAVAIHEGTHGRLPTTGTDRFDTRFAMHACSHPMEQMMAMLALIEGGVLERYPKLKVGFLEAGCGWLPYWLWRMDEEYENLAWEVKDNVKMKPSEYFRRQCFISIEPSEPYLAQIIDFIGSDNLIFGSDYPHIDSDAYIIDKITSLSTISPKIIQKILWDNPMCFYGLT